VPGGFYHVTLRGNHRQPIFFSGGDRTLLNQFVQGALEDCRAQLHAYCWMTNHIHMLIQVAEMPLGAIMLRIASSYARTVQQHMETTGHLFERRYHALLVDADAYLLTLLRYIHFNPVRAGLTSSPAAYPWSSHAVYLGTRNQEWVTTDFALRLFGPDREVARSRYREFTRLPGEDRWGTGSLRPSEQDCHVLGGDEFVARVRQRSRGVVRHRSLESVIDECSRRFGLSRAVLASACRNRRLSEARVWLAREAVESGTTTISAIARELGRGEAAIRRLLQRHAQIDEDEHVRNVRPGTI
jgi:REP element-mobilizing transposase RayT